jgi:CheY-like chemotaxis protein
VIAPTLGKSQLRDFVMGSKTWRSNPDQIFPPQTFQIWFLLGTLLLSLRSLWQPVNSSPYLHEGTLHPRRIFLSSFQFFVFDTLSTFSFPLSDLINHKPIFLLCLERFWNLAFSISPLLLKGEKGWFGLEYVPMNNRKCILVVDDDPDVLLFLEDRLNALGYDVLTAGNGKEALETLHSQSVDGVLLDLNMPVMGGMIMLEKLGNPFENPPIIVMSGNAHRSELLAAMSKGALDWRFKPIDQDELARKCFRLFK